MKQIFKYVYLIAMTVIAAYGLFLVPQPYLNEAEALQEELTQNERYLQERKVILPQIQRLERERKTFVTTESKTTQKNLQKKLKKQQKEYSIKTKKESGKKKKMHITMVGDSVMLGAAPRLVQKIENCTVDAVQSRMLSDMTESLKNMEQIGDVVIIGAGTNGAFSIESAQKLIDYLGKERTVFWINVHGDHLSWKETVNQRIRKIVKKNHNVFLIDFEKEALNHPEWFRADGVHLTEDGKKGYVSLIKQEAGLE